jgi:hypothetical protein
LKRCANQHLRYESREVAHALTLCFVSHRQGVAQFDRPDNLLAQIEGAMYYPEYLELGAGGTSAL